MFIPSDKRLTKEGYIMKQVIKTALHTVYIANNVIACVRCNKTGRFISKKQYRIETRIINFQHISNDLAKTHDNAFNPCLNVTASALVNNLVNTRQGGMLGNIAIDEVFTIAVIFMLFFIVCVIHL